MVGVTIVSVGTSMPELVSSVLAVQRGRSEIVAGNVVGSNVANLLLILGLAAIIGGRLQTEYDLAKVDMPFLAGSAFFLALVLWSGGCRGGRACSACAGSASTSGTRWPAKRRSRTRRSADRAEPPGASRWLRPILVLIGAAGLIYLGADWTVEAVIRISGLVEIGAEVIAASAVALGTSLPEVAVTVAAARRGRPEPAIGNVLCSNVFNAFAVIGASALVGPLGCR